MSKNTIHSNQINVGFALLIVFMLVFFTNRLDKRHFETVQNTLTTVYNDRVIAQDYVYKMSSIINRKHLSLIDSSLKDKQVDLNKEFLALIDVFSSTELTTNELRVFETLKHNFETLEQIEHNNNVRDPQKKQLILLDSIKTDLKNLSLIQVSESKNKVGVAQRSLDTKKLLSTIEIVFLIIIGFVVQFVMFYNVKKSMTQEI